MLENPHTFLMKTGSYIGRKKMKIFKYIIQIIVDVFIGFFIKENGKPNWINIIGAFCLFCVIYAKATN